MSGRIRFALLAFALLANAAWNEDPIEEAIEQQKDPTKTAQAGKDKLEVLDNEDSVMGDDKGELYGIQTSSKGWNSDTMKIRKDILVRSLKEEASNEMKQYWKLGIAFGIVCSTMAVVMIVSTQCTNKNKLEQIGSKSKLDDTGVCSCVSCSKQNLLDEQAFEGETERLNTGRDPEVDPDMMSDESQPCSSGTTGRTSRLLKGGGAGISGHTVLYSFVKNAMGAVTLVTLFEEDLVGCHSSMVMLLGICGVMSIAEGVLILLWAMMFTGDIRNGMRVSCGTIVIAFLLTCVHLILNSVGTKFAYDPPQSSEHGCSVQIYSQAFFTTALVLFFWDLAVVSMELGIVTKVEMNPYTGLGFWKS
mmetsp:Transcript_27401/g.48453  ORF Transcript_27401/g.48453 Transcript_27401/m.48453 type:complete len:361 (+) Transcript_27401:150-1232(+)|eukprot:CAMPEP_0197518698 /NCGR_PEP_ID=MMETSP1318-20131121/3932_1 /TAXON_ID=552666 /ORGANISM="Partenskyella glossopodia, Strain RCC365" /LENGTH=360 /DNA_ID=CAMNT_0043069241 /DNA_START=108 /DNA_END=1190 /DNA_ORIENTATION=-